MDISQRNTKIDEKTIKDLIEGNHLAFSKIYLALYEQFYLLSLRYLKSKEIAEDATQHAFMTLWETRQNIDLSYGVEPYLYRVLKNHILNIFKHQQVLLEKNEEILLMSPAFSEETVLQEMFKKQRSKAIEQALSMLSDQREKICRMKIFDGLSNAEVAEKLGISINTVKVSYYKSILFLRETLKDTDLILAIMFFLSTIMLQEGVPV